MWGWATAAAVLFAGGVSSVVAAVLMPSPTAIATEINQPVLVHPRRTPSGYLMMGAPVDGESVTRESARAWADALEAEGITGVAGFHPPHRFIVEELRGRNIELFHESYPSRYDSYWNFHDFLGYDEPWADPILDFVGRHGARRVAIHCQHGVDRTGNVIAFLLAVRHGVPLNDALYAVVDASPADVAGVAQVLGEFGVNDVRQSGDEGVSTLSYRGSGMSAYNDAFRNYIRATIQAALDRGARLQ